MFVLGFFHGNGPFISKSEPLWAGAGSSRVFFHLVLVRQVAAG